MNGITIEQQMDHLTSLLEDDLVIHHNESTGVYYLEGRQIHNLEAKTLVEKHSYRIEPCVS